MRIESILDALPWPVVICDEAGQVVLANRAVEGMIGTRVGNRAKVTGLVRNASPRPGNFQSISLRQEDGSVHALSAIVSKADQSDGVFSVLVLENRPNEQHPSPRPSTSPAPGQGARLLVVDDEAMVRMVICAVLAQHNYQVVEAGDGEEAIRLCKESPFQLALVDLFMPRMSGLETLKRLRKIQPNLRGLLLSGVADIDEIIRDEELAGVHFLQKPFDNAVLAKVVAQALAESAGGT